MKNKMLNSKLNEPFWYELAKPSHNPPAIYLSEINDGHDDYGNLLNLLDEEDIALVLSRATRIVVPEDTQLFTQGEPYDSIWLIESGSVRSYYNSPSGRECTLAYWGPGHYVGVPELFRDSTNLWSGRTVERSHLYLLRSVDIRFLLKACPNFAIALVEGLVYKGRCLSAILQVLSTRSMQSRLARLLLALSKEEQGTSGVPQLFRRAFTHEELANIIGSTRQWVTVTIKRLEESKLISIDAKRVRVLDSIKLAALAD